MTGWKRWAVAFAIVLAGSLGDQPSASAPNGSTDGRHHSCGYVTEQGVTEHLGDYWARCGQP